MTDTQTTDATTATTPPVPSTGSTSAPSPGYNRNDIFADDGKMWKAKFHGANGAAQQTQARFRDERLVLEQQTQDLTTTISERDATIEALNTTIAAHELALKTVPELQEQIARQNTEITRSNKYRAMLDYPALVSARVTEVVTNEDGTEREVHTNPFLTLIEHSTLEGDLLQAELKRLASAQMASVTTRSSVPITTGVIPTPAPAETVTKETLQAQADAAHAAMVAGDGSKMKEMIDAYAQMGKLE